jgi:ribosomal protein L11 methyltransferase
VTTAAAAEEAAASLLAETFATLAVVHFDALKRTTTVAVFLDARPPDLRRKRAALRAGLRALAADGLDAGPARIRVRRLPPANWAESWKRHFKPLEIGGRLLLKPGWSRRKPKPGQALVVLDPGLSFGTGQHATTAYCLRELVARREQGVKQSLLDVGTGSGVLAIAAAKLGYAPVRAFDCDPEAIRVARANARRNRVLAKLHLARRDLTKLAPKPAERYDVVCANLLAPLLLAERRRLAALVRRGGVLVVAGILGREFAPVRAAYEALGMRLLASRREREWRSATFGLG